MPHRARRSPLRLTRPPCGEVFSGENGGGSFTIIDLLEQCARRVPGPGPARERDVLGPHRGPVFTCPSGMRSAIHLVNTTRSWTCTPAPRWPRRFVRPTASSKPRYGRQQTGVRAICARRMYTHGQTSIAEFTIEGTHTGELMGIPPSGNRARSVLCKGRTVHHGKIYRERDYFDPLSLLTQIGAAPSLRATAAQGV